MNRPLTLSSAGLFLTFAYVLFTNQPDIWEQAAALLMVFAGLLCLWAAFTPDLPPKGLGDPTEGREDGEEGW